MNVFNSQQMTLGSCTIIVAILFSPTLFAADENAGQALFEARCHTCHKQPDPTTPPPDGWVKKLDKMSIFARLKNKQKEDVLAYLLHHSQDEMIKSVVADDQQLLKEKCTACHSMGRIVLEKFDGDIGQHILDRMQSYAGTSQITNDELNRILAYLQDQPPLPKPERVETSDPAQLLATRCTACHSLERVFAKIRADGNTDATWMHIISRMREKAPDWVSEDEAAKLADYITALETDPGAR